MDEPPIYRFVRSLKGTSDRMLRTIVIVYTAAFVASMLFIWVMIMSFDGLSWFAAVCVTTYLSYEYIIGLIRQRPRKWLYNVQR